MGSFISTTAFKNISEEKISRFILEYLDRCEIKYFESTYIEEYDKKDVIIFKMKNNWTVIIWPDYFPDFMITMELSEVINTTISSMHIYDGDYWAHLLVGEKSEILEKYCTNPYYFERPNPNNKKLKEEWKGNIEGVSKYFNIDRSQIEDFYWSTYKKINPITRLIKKILGAFPIYYDCWSFTEYWEKMGIEYPNDDDKIYRKYRIDNNCMEKILLKESKYKFYL